MKKPMNGRDLASEILARSTCSVKVGAAIADHHGIFSWGWNSSGSGYGQCAERHAIQRANKRRLYGATIYIASVRRRNNKMVPSKPCVECQKVIDKHQLHIEWRDNDGEWRLQG